MTINDDPVSKAVILFLPCFADSNGGNDKKDTNDEGREGERGARSRGLIWILHLKLHLFGLK